MAELNTSLGPQAPTLEQRLAVPTGWSNLNNSFRSMGDYLMQQQGLKQELQRQMAMEAGKAQFEAWGKMQDPIARALTMGKLGEMGYPVGQMHGMGMPSMSDMLSGNPYAKYVLPQGAGFGGSSMPSSTGQPQAANPQQSGQFQVMGLPGSQSNINVPNSAQGTGGSPQDTSGGWLATTAERNPFGGYMAKEIQNVPAQQTLESSKKYAESSGAAKGQEDQAYNMLNGIIDNYIPVLKSAYIESAGGGPLTGNIMQFAANHGAKNTQNITALEEVHNQAALAEARLISGGSRGVATIYNNFKKINPDITNDPNNSFSLLAEQGTSAFALKNAMDRMGLSPKFVGAIPFPPNDITDAQVKQLDKFYQEEMNKIPPGMNNRIKQFALDRINATPPAGELNVRTGQMEPPKKSPVVDMMPWNMFQNKQFTPAGAQYQPSQPQNQQNSKASYVKKGTLPDGRRVGVKADGSTEIISGQ